MLALVQTPRSIHDALNDELYRPNRRLLGHPFMPGLEWSATNGKEPCVRRILQSKRAVPPDLAHYLL